MLPFNLPQCQCCQNAIASVVVCPLLHAGAVRFWGAAACSLSSPPFPLCSCWETWLVLGFTPPALQRPLRSGHHEGEAGGGFGVPLRAGGSAELAYEVRPHVPRSPKALASCSALASPPARLLVVLWDQHISHCAPSHCSDLEIPDFLSQLEQMSAFVTNQFCLFFVCFFFPLLFL